jgi:predicted outer membrane repeat protein
MKRVVLQKRMAVISVIVLILISARSMGQTIYVDAGATGANNGTSWTNAFVHLQDALASPPGGSEVWVAQGVYQPDQGLGMTAGDRTASFQLSSEVAIYGGFPPGGGTWQQRDPKAYETILSGDLNGDDGPKFTFYEDNSYHVVIGDGTDRSAVLDGFTIRGGSATGSYPNTNGGGMYCLRGSPTVVDCVFNANQASYYGGGFYHRYDQAKLIRCDFIDNYAGDDGGAVKNWDGTNLELIACRFLGNRAGRGAGVSEYSGVTTMINCLFSGNEAVSMGYGGGGAVVASYGTVDMVNCTLVGNAALGTSATGLGGGVYVYYGTANLTNCIIWDNRDNGGIDASAQIHVDTGGSTNLNYNCILGWGGVGTNISDDPLFQDANGADQVYGNEDDNPRLRPGSPCLDAGNNAALPPDVTTDLDGQDRIQNGIVDMGVFEGVAPGILLNTDFLSVFEGATGLFTVTLSQDPGMPVPVEMEHTGGDPDIILLTASPVILDSSNYQTGVEVSVIAQPDADQLQGTAIIQAATAGYWSAGLTVQEQEPNPTSVIYVDQSAAGTNDGSSWANAFVDLQDGIQYARTHAEISEIHVAQGIYCPAGADGDRTISFELLSNVSILGGFPSSGGTIEQRDPQTYDTILSGDLNGDDLAVADPRDLLTETSREENSVHVVQAYLSDETAILDGFVISGGKAETAYPDYNGGGIFFNGGCKATIRHCRFQANSAFYGGGLYGDVIVEQCLFRGNAATYSGGGAGGNFEMTDCVIEQNYAENNGGGINVRESIVKDCRIQQNTAAGRGGGICVDVSTQTCIVVGCTIVNNTANKGGGAASIGCTCGGYPYYINCRFLGNTATTSGGGLFSEGYIFNTLTNCVFSGNTTEGDGGAIYDGYDSTSDIYDCTISQNHAVGDGGGANFNYDRERYVYNSIFWLNTDQFGNGVFSQISGYEPILYYCCVQNWNGELGGVGNHGQDPEFIDADGPDNQAGTEDDNLRLLSVSPCVDTGHNSYIGEDSADLDGDGYIPEPIPFDLDGDARIHNVTVDMGAYEFFSPKVIYVDADAAGANDGSSWANAYVYLQDGLADAGYGDEIRVAQGCYRPDQGAGNTTGDSDATFQLVNGVELKGGYAGFGQPDPDARDIEEFATCLSGDLGSVKSYHVVTGTGTDQATLLEGFTIQDGDGLQQGLQLGGGGMNNDPGSPTVRHCCFMENQAHHGAGIYFGHDSNALVVNCRFEEGGIGTALSSLEIVNCDFINIYWAAIESYGGELNITNCVFRDNYWGLFIDYCDPILTNCTFYENDRAIEYDGGSEATLYNCIVWNNDYPLYAQRVYHSCIDGTWGEGSGNLTEDPMFVADEEELYLADGSPCIDTGSNAWLPLDVADLDGDGDTTEPIPFDRRGNSRVFNTTVDMGAYEIQGQWIYVDVNATGQNNGTSWADAYTNLHSALAWATKGNEYWIAQGVYVPTQAYGMSDPGREATFELVSGVAMFGGFPTGGGTWEERDPVAYETILSGDRNGDDGPEFANTDDNCYHVLTASGTDNSTLLDGLTITAGNAEGSEGGGLFCSDYPAITKAKLVRCTFRNNQAYQGGGIYGGKLEAIDCIFMGNSAEYSGGGWDHPSDARLINCLFSGNRTDGSGGAIFCPCTDIEMINCTVSGNVAEGEDFYRGGGICGDDDTDMFLTNCIFWGNRDIDGIVESSQIWQDYISQTHVNYCCVQGWTGILGGAGNHGNDPLFLDPDGVDNRLGTPDDNLRLLPGSPCLDVGDNTILPAEIITDLDGESRILNSIVDMGAYEGQHQGFILSRQHVQITEGLGGSFTVRLAQDPGSTVLVHLSIISGDGDFSLITNTPLSFDSSNYQGPKNVTIAAAQDADILNGVALVYLYAAEIGAAGVTVTEWDDDAPAVIYVDDDSPVHEIEHGASWADAYWNLQDAIHFAAAIPQVEEIRVAQGVYTPTGPGGDRTQSFSLLNGVAIRGGYAGLNLPNPNARDMDQYETILSGDLNGDDAPVFANRSDNSFHVVFTELNEESAVLEGFTIQGGQADVSEQWPYTQQHGGGIYISSGSPSISFCRLTDNYAVVHGGGMYIRNKFTNQLGGPRLLHCVFDKNRANSGGGMYIYKAGDTRVLNSSFIGNTANWGGGGVLAYSDSLFVNCIFSGNSVVENGGAVRIHYRNHPEFINCSFSRNTSGQRGGGIYQPSDCDLTLTNCILWDNQDAAGTDYSAQIDYNSLNNPHINYCTILGYAGTPNGIANNNVNPLFVDADGLDDIVGTLDDNLRLQENSPGINTGSNNAVPPFVLTDRDGYQRIHEEIVDRGAYEYHVSDLIYVDADAVGVNNGSSWANAFIYLQDALAVAGYGDEIRVAQGTYRPDQGGDNTLGDPEATFLLVNAVALKGGYAGFGEPDPDARDMDAYQTILSGDLISVKCYHVITGTGTDRSTLLEGFIIRDGDGLQQGLQLSGGGIYNQPGSPTIRNCRFRENRAHFGAAIYNGYGSNTLIVHCVFFAGGGIGNALSNVDIFNCEFEDIFPVAIETYGGELNLTNCVLRNNGWGLFIDYCDPILTNCTFYENDRAIEYDGGSEASLYNCIVWDSGQPLHARTVYNSCIDGTWDIGTDNITDNPQFVGANLRLLSHSPCLDAGNNSWLPFDIADLDEDGDTSEPIPFDRDNHQRILNGIVDMGAYEFMPPGSLIAHWKLDESEGSTAEDSIGDNDGTLASSPIWKPNEGKVDGALWFDGHDDYVACGNSPVFNLTNAITVAAWVNLAQVDEDWQAIVAKGDSAWRLSLVEQTQRFHFAVTGEPYHYVNGTTVVGLDEWHHVCGTYDGEYIRLYVDGVEDPASPIAYNGGITTNDYPVYIGENAEITDREWSGMIDDVRFYNYALSAEEVARLILCPTIYYVDAAAAPGGNGLTWNTAFQFPQDALNRAQAGDQIRVAAGTYCPDQNANQPDGSGIRTATFHLISGVALYGGFPTGGSDWEGRDPNRHISILSGDLNGNDAGDIRDPSRDENSFHVVTGSGADETAILDGFTITAGNAYDNGECNSNAAGGGMYNESGNPRVSNCTFIRNSAGDNCGRGGGGMYNRYSHPLVLQCRFIDNHYINANDDGGGGICNSYSNPTLVDCYFAHNYSEGYGGGMRNYRSNPHLTNCVFYANEAQYEGGGITNYDESNPVMIDCEFNHNLAYYSGGGIRDDFTSSSQLIRCIIRGNEANYSIAQGGGIYSGNASLQNCLVTGNVAIRGGGLYSYHGTVALDRCTFHGNRAEYGGGLYFFTTNATLTNSIVWGNDAPQGKEIYSKNYLDPKTLAISYCDIEGGLADVLVEAGNILNWGPGNIDVDPLFDEPGHWDDNSTPDDPSDDNWICGDYHLQSIGWRWDPQDQEWTLDHQTSRCIDAGNPGTPLRQEPMTVPTDPFNLWGINLRVNMGAYGGTAEASMPPYDWCLLGDMTNDGITNLADYAIQTQDWLQQADEQPGDLNRNQIVNVTDLNLLLADWLKTTSWYTPPVEEEWKINQITDNAYRDENPEIDYPYVVWNAKMDTEEAENWEIFLYDISTQTTTRLTFNDYNDFEIEISGTKIVWSGRLNNEVKGAEIFLYDIQTHETRRLTENNYYESGPRVSGNYVVWYGRPNGDYDTSNEIFLYNLETEEQTRITNNNYNDDYAEIFGLNVVWHAYDDGSDSEIYHYDISTGITSPLTENGYHDTYPHICGSCVAWAGAKNAPNGWEGEIFLYDLDTGVTRQLTNTRFYADSYPLLTDTQVVWSGWDYNSQEVYVYDMETGVTTMLSDNTYYDFGPRISGSQIVWVREFYDDAEDTKEIMLFDGTAITKLTNNDFQDRSPRISNGVVVWYGPGYSDDTEIFLAVKK